MATSTPRKAAEYRKIGSDLVQVYPETVTSVISLEGYTKPSSTSALADEDLLNTALGKLEKGLDGKAPVSHDHGNIKSGGNVGNTANLPLITGTGGIVQTGSFGTTANTFCQGNDSRLSNARTPTSHTHGQISNDGKITNGTANAVVITNESKTVTTSSTISVTELNCLDGVTGNIQTQIDNINTALAGGMNIKGSIGTNGTITALPANHTKGDAYYALAGAPTINNVAAEAGDVFICIESGTSANNAHWIVVQNNVDVMKAATSSAAGGKGLVPAPAAGDQNKVLSGAGTWVAQTTNTDAKVAQSVVSTDDAYPILLKNAPNANNEINSAHFVDGVSVNPVNKTITAEKFIGGLRGTAETADALSIARTITLSTDVSGSASFDGSANVTIATTLANSGVTANTYGDDGNTRTLAHSGSFKIPYITVDAKGRITSAATKTLTLPASGNTDTKVNMTKGATTKAYLLGTSTAPTTSAQGVTSLADDAVYLTTEAGTLHATKFDGTNFTGTAAKATADASGNTITSTYLTAVGSTPASNTLQVTKNGTASNVSLPKWASYGTELPSATEIAAMPDGACFLLLAE